MTAQILKFMMLRTGPVAEAGPKLFINCGGVIIYNPVLFTLLLGNKIIIIKC